MNKIDTLELAKQYAIDYVSKWDNVSDVKTSQIEKEKSEENTEIYWDVQGTYIFKKERNGEFSLNFTDSGTILGYFSSVYPLKSWEVAPGPK